MKKRSYDIVLIAFVWIGMNAFILRIIAVFNANAPAFFDPLFPTLSFETIVVNILSCFFSLTLYSVVLRDTKKANKQ